MYLKKYDFVTKVAGTLRGEYPLIIRLQCNILKYLHRLYNFPVNSVHGRIIQMLQKHKDQGKRNWLTTAESVYEKFQAVNNMSMDTFLAKSDTAVKPLLKSTLRKQYESQWKTLISDINKQPKLRTYCTFKSEFKRRRQQRFQEACTNIGKKIFLQISAIYI